MLQLPNACKFSLPLGTSYIRVHHVLRSSDASFCVGISSNSLKATVYVISALEIRSFRCMAAMWFIVLALAK